MSIRVFLLDDHELVRRGLADFLAEEQDVEVVGEAGTAAEALVGIAATQPDVAVLDVRLPDGDGIEVCREVLSSCPNTRCLILTSFGGDEAMTDAILAGAHGFVLKETRATELVEDIRRVATGDSLLDPASTRRVFDRMRQQLSATPQLSEQEQKILELMVEGLTNREIGERMFLAEQTVKNYVSRLFGKLGVKTRTQAVALASRRLEEGRVR